MTDRKYLENKLQELKVQLMEITMKNSIQFAEFEAKKRILDEQIVSIEVQLSDKSSN